MSHSHEPLIRSIHLHHPHAAGDYDLAKALKVLALSYPLGSALAMSVDQRAFYMPASAHTPNVGPILAACRGKHWGGQHTFMVGPARISKSGTTKMRHLNFPSRENQDHGAEAGCTPTGLTLDEHKKFGIMVLNMLLKKMPGGGSLALDVGAGETQVY